MVTLTYDQDTTEYLLEIVHPYVWLKSHPVTEPLAADLLPLRDEWKAILLKEIQLTENVAEAEALVMLGDFNLDGLLNAILNALRTVANNDMTSPVIVRFLGKSRAFEVRAPIMGEQLEQMRTWPPGLAMVPSDEVNAKGLALAAFIPQADKLVDGQRKAEQELTDFTELGARKAFVDHLNATRKLLFGKISELMHTPAGASLPADFPSRCFPAEIRTRGPSIKSEERTIKRLKSQLTRHEGILTALKEKEEANKKARAEAEKTAVMEEAEALKKDAEAKLARAAELEAKLGKKPDET